MASERGSANDTPKKYVKKKGRPPKTKCKDDFCRICNLDFLVQLGNSKCSTENLFKESGRKECKGVILATVCQDLGLDVRRADHLSDRVCRSCARKIRNAKENLDFLKSHLTESRASEPIDADCIKQLPQRGKRQLPTTITPERIVSQVKKPKSNELHSRKQLLLEYSSVPCTYQEEDYIQNLMNIDTFEDEHAKKRSQVRVIISYPNGNQTVKHGFDETTTSLIRNIATKHWSAAVNIVFKHDEMSCHLPDSIRRRVNSEFEKFGQNTILAGTSLAELTAFNNNLLLQEVKVFCPFWFSAINGVCGHTLRQSKERQSSAVNVMALSTSVLARQRNPKLSALAYKISVLLFHSGVKYQDIQRLNRLGVCMSPKRIVDLQKRMGIACNSTVLIWKRTIEETLSALDFLRDLKKHQVPELTEDDMDVEREIDVREQTVKDYSSFSKPTHEFCLKLLNEARNKRAEIAFNDEILEDAIYLLQNKSLPHFR